MKNYIVDNLQNDGSRGHNFQVLFDKPVSLEEASRTIYEAFRKQTNRDTIFKMRRIEGKLYGYIAEETFNGKQINVEVWPPSKKDLSDLFLARENNHDFTEFKRFYEAMQ